MSTRLSYIINMKCRFFAQNGWLHFQAVLHSSQPSSKILRSCVFREELDCTTPDLQAFFCGLLPGRKTPRVSSFLQDEGWRTLDTNELALNTSLERCKCTWLVHSAVFFTDVHEKSAQQNVELVKRNVFQGSCLSN